MIFLIRIVAEQSRIIKSILTATAQDNINNMLYQKPHIRFPDVRFCLHSNSLVP
ncbi:hypothetical protein DET54_104183 [Paenibacillus pabuli]|uniref:Uncharacterized protein n=1 Tax=Paenibacillus pabuli TaxID=1472 RepID=A0ABX9BMA5_9BACL|nr:hypothetical protein DET54_104183 [Paenibacillus pabuli]